MSMGRDPGKTFTNKTHRAQMDRVSRRAKHTQAKYERQDERAGYEEAAFEQAQEKAEEARRAHDEAIRETLRKKEEQWRAANEEAMRAKFSQGAWQWDGETWHSHSASQSNPVLSFVEDGWSLEFAEFCLLHDVKVEVRWTDSYIGPLQTVATLKSGKPIHCSLDLKSVHRADDIQRETESLLKAYIEAELWKERFPGRVKKDCFDEAERRQGDIRSDLYRNGRSADLSLWSDPAYRQRKQSEARKRTSQQKKTDGWRGFERMWSDEFEHQDWAHSPTAEKIWEELKRSAFGGAYRPSGGFDEDYVRRSREARQEAAPKPKPAGDYRAGKEYTDAQRSAIDKARKARNLRDDERCDPGTRGNAGRKVFQLLNANGLTEWDLM